MAAAQTCGSYGGYGSYGYGSYGYGYGVSEIAHPASARQRAAPACVGHAARMGRGATRGPCERTPVRP